MTSSRVLLASALSGVALIVAIRRRLALSAREVKEQAEGAAIRRITSIAELPALVRPGDLLCLDIDETLVKPEAADASEAWFVAFCGALQGKCRVGGSTAFEAGVLLWEALQRVCDVRAPEGEVTRSALAAAAKVPGVRCVGLTARGPEAAEETAEQLRRCGVSNAFEAVSLGTLAPAEVGATVAPLTHLDGVIYCSGPRKPAGLLAFEAVSAPGAAAGGRVVLLDDRARHVEAMRQTMSERGRPFLGLVYEPVGEAAATAQCDLGRGWQLFAALLAHRRGGRDRLRSILDLLDAAEARAEAEAGARAGAA